MSDNTPKEVESVVKKSFETFAKLKKEYSEEQLQYIIRTIAPTLNKDEVILFIMRCEKLGIDPMSGDITAYISLSKNKETGLKTDRKLTMIVARNWKRERGMSNPHVKSIKLEAIYTKEETEVARTYNANEVTVDALKKSGEQIRPLGEMVEVTKKVTVKVPEWAGGILWGAVCTIVRDDYNEPFVVTVPLKEYKGYQVWDSKPETMIKKVAESQCWDLAVPELSRVYDEAERFDNTEKSAPTIEGGSEPATPEQISTIEKLAEIKGKTEELGDLTELSKQEAVNIIKDLSSSK
jgi:RecT family